MIQTKLKGMGVALITPFKEDESVDYDALMRMVDYLLQNNADFLCVLGTTAETPTLTEEEKKTIKKMVIDRVNGRIPILLGVGGNNTRAIVETLKNDACELIRKNRAKFHACNLILIEGRAPDVLADLPAPDAVFIGGTKGGMEAVLDEVLGKNPNARICISAIALETLSAAAH